MTLAILLILVLPIIAVSTLLLLRKRVTTIGSSDLDPTSWSFTGGVLSSLFTIILAFYIVFAWQHGDDVDRWSESEANALIDLYWQAEAAPEPGSSTIQALASDYADRVTRHEWASLSAGRTDPETDEILHALRTEVTNLPTDTEEVTTAREQALRDLRTIDENHRARVAQATYSDGFTVVLLTGSIIGAMLMIAFPLLVGLPLRGRQITAMALVSAGLGAVIYLAVELTNPLDGPFSVEPEPFRTAVGIFTENDRPDQ